MEQEVVIDKLVHGGQGLGVAADGRKVFVWNALPGERVLARLGKRKKSYAEGVAIEIIEPSADRIDPRDEAYLSTSPWQIMPFEVENRYKQEILAEAFAREHVVYEADIPFHAGKQEWYYRNKMEYSFWADDDGLHLALFHRASHGKRIITGSSIAMPIIDEVATKVLALLNKREIRGSQLKTIVIRANQAGEAVVALFVKDQKFPTIKELAETCKGVAVYFSNPKSPASVLTRELYSYGDITLTDVLVDVPISYDVNSFFQVNLEIFEQALGRIDYFTATTEPRIDMYAGVGTIGLCIGGDNLLVELDKHNCEMARRNAAGRQGEVIEAPAEKAVEYITGDKVLIVDPPRAGLHADVTARIREVQPPTIAYLSCNPSTQARDIALLQDIYDIQALEGYNFFPRTPHIESLIILKRK